MKEIQEILNECSVEGHVVKLPARQLDRKDYEQVKRKLTLIGGRWTGGKVQGFVFQEDPTELLTEVSNGANRNLKQEFQFFATPSSLAKRMVEMANIQPGDRILEPSAGQGAIIKEIQKAVPGQIVYWCETMPLNKTFLQKMENAPQWDKTDDFLGTRSVCFGGMFDRIIANPPFNKNQDIDHIKMMFHALKPGGRIVTIASPSWTFGSQKKQVEFKQWLDEIDATITELEPGEFKESGTNIRAMLLVIDKPLK